MDATDQWKPGRYSNTDATLVFDIFGIGMHTEDNSLLSVCKGMKSPFPSIMPIENFVSADMRLIEPLTPHLETLAWDAPRPNEPKPGIYRNFKKSNEYRIFGHLGYTLSLSDERLGVYEALETGELYFRPSLMFLEQIERPELRYTGPRFIYLRDA